MEQNENGGDYTHAEAVRDLIWARDAARGDGADAAGGVNLTAFLRAVEQLIGLSGLKGAAAPEGAPVVIYDDLPDVRGPDPCAK